MFAAYFPDSNMSTGCLPNTTNSISHNFTKPGLWKISLYNDTQVQELFASVQERISLKSIKVSIKSVEAIELVSYLVLSSLNRSNRIHLITIVNILNFVTLFWSKTLSNSLKMPSAYQGRSLSQSSGVSLQLGPDLP